jgi:hypothetical protein
MRRMISALILSAVLILAASANAQESAFPRIVQHSHATYPPAALSAGVQGDVIVKFTTDGRAVTFAQATSGPAPLQDAAVSNVKTWSFGRHTAGSFTAIFRFKILGPDHATEDIFPGLPNLIEVVGLTSATAQTDH